MLRFNHVLIALGMMVVATGCGNQGLTDSLNIFLDPDEQVARMEVQLGDGLEVQLDGEFPLADGYGRLFFEPATRVENSRIIVELDVGRIVQDQIDLDGYGVITGLPNGASLPVSMTPPLIGVPVTQGGSVNVTAAIGIYPELQIGAVIDVAELRAGNFPEGVSICQNFRNEDNYAFASACLYGPSNGRSGGIFIGGNFGDVLGDLLDAPAEQPAELLALRSSGLAMALASSSVAALQMAPVRYVSESSQVWTESRHGRNKNKLRYKHWQSVKRVFKAR